MAEGMGVKAIRVEDPHKLEAAMREVLAHKGPALLDVVSARQELVMPPKIEIPQVFGTALYSAKAMLSGRGSDVMELLTDNFLK